MRVCVGGTFDHLHKGHKLLLEYAVKTAGANGFVYIGLATGPLIASKRHVESFQKRKEKIVTYLKDQQDTIEIQIEGIQTIFGPTLTSDFDAIIISTETRPTAEKINREREKRGMQKMNIIQIPYLLAKDGRPISSTRIRHKEIDSQGNILNIEEKGD